MKIITRPKNISKRKWEKMLDNDVRKYKRNTKKKESKIKDD